MITVELKGETVFEIGDKMLLFLNAIKGVNLVNVVREEGSNGTGEAAGNGGSEVQTERAVSKKTAGGDG